MSNRSNSKVVKDAMREHVLNYYTKEDIADMVKARNYDNSTIYATGKHLVEDGNFDIYFDDQRKTLELLDLNNNSNKTFTDEQVYNMYKHLVAVAIEDMMKEQ